MAGVVEVAAGDVGVVDTNGPRGTRTLMRYYPRGILSPLRLPIPPQAQREKRNFTRINNPRDC